MHPVNSVTLVSVCEANSPPLSRRIWSGPLRGVFRSLRRRDILRHVRTLILDRLSVTADLVSEILIDSAYNVRILSLLDVGNLNEGKLRQALAYVCRPGRPEGTPRLKGLYILGTTAKGRRADGREHLPSSEEQTTEDAWYVRRGELPLRREIVLRHWAPTILACRDAIAFDGVLCEGPRHPASPAFNPRAAGDANNSGDASSFDEDRNICAVATVSLGPCAQCGSAPEAVTVYDEAVMATASQLVRPVGYLPLLSPPPLHSATVAVAVRPRQDIRDGRAQEAFAAAWRRENQCDLGDETPYSTTKTTKTASGKVGAAHFVARCRRCLENRHCTRCNRWWCEACYMPPRLGQPGDPGTAAVIPGAPGSVNSQPGTQSIASAGFGFTPTSASAQEALAARDVKVRNSTCRDCFQRLRPADTAFVMGT